MASEKSVLEHTFKFLDLYVPQWFEKRDLSQDKSPLFILLSGPQGSGKSYTAQFVYKYLLEKYGESKRVVQMSIDDFYLTHEDQKEFSDKFADNKLLQGRGLPGTHDIPLLSKCINALISGEDSKVILPQYDKSKFNGEGDRCAKGKEVTLPLDIVVLEGWFLGFSPILERQEISTNPHLQSSAEMVQVNANLFFYKDMLWNNPEIKSLGIVFAADDIHDVYKWRLEQEQALRKTTGEGMTDEEVKKFIDRYFPCYQLYYDDLVSGEDLGSIATLTLGIDLQRTVYSAKERCIE
ncbi:putative ATP-dependent kinase TDEL_0E04970 [Torulaspora delbrueckii]|uniref:Phosphoribulokinase/uridine kinase domain-containing protein n=1 Tax=Torulaspora delbrueckii TaxID=4950 RepID=G8ZVU6_TORDE|nr:hypothetical protein TDEL_0E04970 [Torulaspora delbrueckii]CCE92740.1 hypothetical protein TDEL_0E04970 [Torulaspora delbrueckii]